MYFFYIYLTEVYNKSSVDSVLARLMRWEINKSRGHFILCKLFSFVCNIIR